MKQKILDAIGKVSADATLEDAIERLVLLANAERGLAELNGSEGIDHAEAIRAHVARDSATFADLVLSV